MRRQLDFDEVLDDMIDSWNNPLPPDGPLVVYTGTQVSIDASPVAQGPSRPPGIYFTTLPQICAEVRQGPDRSASGRSSRASPADAIVPPPRAHRVGRARAGLRHRAEILQDLHERAAAASDLERPAPHRRTCSSTTTR